MKHYLVVAAAALTIGACASDTTEPGAVATQRSYQQELDQGLWEFLSNLIDVNADLRIRLLHGKSDRLPYQDSVEFETLLTEAGLDVEEVVVFDGGHFLPTEVAVPTIVKVIGQ
jgi:hypothetical protein